MAVQNKVRLKIDGINYSKYLIVPTKYCNLLDERLDEAYISLRFIPKKTFNRLAKIELTITNTVYFGNYNDTQTKTMRFLLANDSEGTESPNGSGFYNHDLYIIEETKYLEMIIVDSLTFTNVLGKNYLNSAAAYTLTGTGSNYMYAAQNSEKYKTLAIAGTPYDFAAPYDMGFLYDNNMEGYRTYNCNMNYGLTVTDASGATVLECTVVANSLSGGRGLTYASGSVGSYSTSSPRSDVYPPVIGSAEIAVWEDLKSRFIPLSGRNYTATYSYVVSPAAGLEAAGVPVVNAELSFAFSVVSNQYPLKRITCTDVINRLLDIAEPVLQGQASRFTLNAEQAELFDRIYAPQFSMTKQTLRECLQEVGKVVHGEPRLHMNDDGTGEIVYDMYGGMARSNISKRPYSEKTVSATIDSYCTSIDSSAQNLINQLDYAAGVITEPYVGGYKTVRTETQYVRISDENMIIATDRPIYQIVQVKCGIVPKNEDIRFMDITPFVFESTIYNSQLSSYKQDYPYSKAYGLYFTQGQKNILGLNFKADDDHIIFPAFGNYSIYNILERVSGRSLSDLAPKDNEYPLLAFQVTYLPFFNVRVKQTKSNFKDYATPAALAYNQQANVIESTYYGENLKGAVARLGNVEMTKTYLLAKLNQIPTAGDLYDEEYYISAVSVEVMPTCFICTIGLSKDFNRLNEYIGIDSEKRYYEVSERQAYDRDSLFSEYIVIGDEEASGATLIGFYGIFAIYDTFVQTGIIDPITRVVAWGGTYQNPTTVNVGETIESPLPTVQLPVTSCALGNSIVLIWGYADNYSAGAVSTYAEGGSGGQKVSGYFQDDYQYTDYYGRMYHYNFDVQTWGTEPTDFEQQTEIGTSLPQGRMPTTSSGIISTLEATPYRYRKDSREIPQINFQIELVANRKDLIIGSALAASCPLIRKADESIKAKLYLLDEPLNKFTRHVEGGIDIDLSMQTSVDFSYGGLSTQSKRFYLKSSAFTKDCKCWAFITGQQTYTETVEDEEGNVITQTMYKGGDLLLACNGDFKAGDTIGQIWFTPRHDLYGREYWLQTFSDTSLTIPPDSPEAIQIYSETFSDSTYTQPASEPTSINSYTETFSDTSVTETPPSPTPVSIYTETFSDTSLAVVERPTEIDPNF